MTATSERAPRVKILYFDGCPNRKPARALVEQVAAELGVEPEIDLVEVADPEAARELRFLGTPTIRVNGRDVEPGGTSVATSFSPAAFIGAGTGLSGSRRWRGSARRWPKGRT